MRTSKIIAALLALLGFSRCGDDAGKEMYGVPNASFRISGTVVDEAGDPLKDIKIVITEGEEGYEQEMVVGITDSRGYYDIGGGWFPGERLAVSTEDIDGEKNGGEFAPETVEIKITSDDYVGGEGWNRGTVIKTADFELELKPQNDENE